MTTPNITSSPSFWKSLRNRMFGAPEYILEVGERRRIELLAGFAFLLMISTGTGTFAILAANPGQIRASAISLGITFSLVLTAYILSRTKFYAIGSVLLPMALSLTAFMTIIGGTDSPTSTLYSSIPMALILASAFFSIRGLAITLVFNVIGIILLPYAAPYYDPASVTSTLGIIVTLGVLLIIVGNVRNAVEATRLAEFKQANKELEVLRDSLEIRVEERTQALTTSQMQTQTLLKELAEALDIALLGNWEYDFVNDVFTFNDAFYTMMRTTVEREGGYQMNAARYTERFVYPEDAPTVGIEIGRSIETTDPNFSTEVDHRVIFGDGEIGYVRVRFRIEKDVQGRTVKSYGANQDITAQKRADEALAERARELENTTGFLNTIIETLPVMLFVKDAQELRFVRWNKAAKQITGFSFDDVRGKNDRDFFPAEEAEFFMSKDREVLTSQQELDIPEEPIQTLHQGQRWLHTRKMPVLNAQGEPVYLLGIAEDITERKKIDTILAKRATELETVTQVATSIATIQNPLEMLQFVSDLTKERFNFYHAHVYLLDEVNGMLELAAGSGDPGKMMVAQKHAIPLAREQSLVARAARTRQGVVVNDVTQAADFLPNPLLPDTRAELAVPLIFRDEVLGVLDVQSAEANSFTEEDIRTQTILAAQIAVVLKNARSNAQTAKTLQELDSLNRRLIHEGWETYMLEKERTQMGYVFEGNQVLPLHENGHISAGDAEKSLVQPVVLRGEKIGQVVATDAEMEETELQAVLAAISEGLSAHLENLRLTEEAERRVNELDIINDIGQALATEVDLQKILPSILEKLSKAFNANIVYAALYDSARQEILIPYMLEHGRLITDEPLIPFGTGINSTIIRTRQTIFVNKDTINRLQEFGAIPTMSNNALSKSYIGVPLVAGENVIGVLSVQDADREGRFTQGDVDLLTTIAASVAVAIQNAQLFEQTQKRAEREMIVNQIGQKIQSATSVQSALQTAIQELGLALKARKTVVKLAAQAEKPQETSVATD